MNYRNALVNIVLITSNIINNKCKASNADVQEKQEQEEQEYVICKNQIVVNVLMLVK